ncbi:hypothetical protein [Flammeovirga aprica]|uniref:DUF4251 domain-containing protein n=1 Tax=Flammeovirga aprica JL-4 TaxID=694437 RepID=A0A7X9RXG3_9BACT|nr:hypothetical protein [Flammeovirga aprica]NME70578.1 hypothetical protein [Flammeovirga aprica JL-4]
MRQFLRFNTLFYTSIILAMLAITHNVKAQEDFMINTGYVSTRTTLLNFNNGVSSRDLHPNSMIMLTIEGDKYRLAYLCIDELSDEAIEGSYEIVKTKSNGFKYEFDPVKIGDPKVNIFIPDGGNTWNIIVRYFDGRLINMSGVREITPEEYKILSTGKSPYTSK